MMIYRTAQADSGAMRKYAGETGESSNAKLPQMAAEYEPGCEWKVSVYVGNSAKFKTYA